MSQLTQLTGLYAQNNCFARFPAPVCSLGASLLNLNAAMNGMRALPPAISSLTSLQVLDLTDNSLSAIDPVRAHSSLARLHRAGGDLLPTPARLHVSCWATESCTMFTAMCTSLIKTASPVKDSHPTYTCMLLQAIGALTSLTRLDLHSNSLTALCSEVGALKALQKLSLHNNCLVEVPASIGALTCLTWLSLNSNSLVRLPDEIAGCAPLRVPVH